MPVDSSLGGRYPKFLPHFNQVKYGGIFKLPTKIFSTFVPLVNEIKKTIWKWNIWFEIQSIFFRKIFIFFENFEYSSKIS